MASIDSILPQIFSISPLNTPYPLLYHYSHEGNKSNIVSTTRIPPSLFSKFLSYSSPSCKEILSNLSPLNFNASIFSLYPFST